MVKTFQFIKLDPTTYDLTISFILLIDRNTLRHTVAYLIEL